MVAPMILVCGEALYDLFLTDGDPQGVVAIEAWPGGSPFNAAIGLARLYPRRSSLLENVIITGIGGVAAIV